MSTTTKTNDVRFSWNNKQDGYREEMDAINKILLAMYDSANSTFWKQRDEDPYYSDPRTDYLLGKRDAISDLISYIDKTMAHYGETIHVKGDN